MLGVCEGVIHAGKEADVSGLRRAVPRESGCMETTHLSSMNQLRRAVPLELGCMETTHLSSMACKVSATDCPDVGIGKRHGRQVKPLGAIGCLVANDLMSRKRRPACLTTN